jgi:DNA-directed RNA polymerase subunit RPC12/RpoP
MPELSRIETTQRMACPHCRNVIEELDMDEALEGGTVHCPYCGGAIKLPEGVVERHRRSKYVGRTLDITC